MHKSSVSLTSKGIENSMKSTARETLHVHYISASRGLTPYEREVELKIGTSTYRVLVPRTAVNSRAKTLTVTVVDGSDRDRFCVIDLGGESLNSSRRVRVTRSHLAQVRS